MNDVACEFVCAVRPGSYVAFLRVEFNSIKCGRNATVDSYVAIVSNLIQN